MNTKLIYVTVPSYPEAKKIAETVVTEHVAACANIFDGITSIFEWEGKLCRENETALILKTSANRVDDLTARIKALHSYDCPCIVALPIESGSPAFIHWIEKSVTG